jgi:protein-S-isoprenylcysteine O-methyltransferase Ste14
MHSIDSAFLVLPMAACTGSFAWGMRRFFVHRGPLTAGLKVTTSAGLISACLQAAVILTARSTIALCAGGTVLYCVSLLLFWRAIAANRERRLPACFTSARSAYITMSGPYRLVRHPFYCAYLLAWLAGFVGTGSLWLLPTVAAMSAIYVVAAFREEQQFVDSPLAADYEDYRNRTGMFFPVLRVPGIRS